MEKLNDHPYVHSILGQRHVFEVPKSSNLGSELLRADSLWAKGQYADTLKVLSEISGLIMKQISKSLILDPCSSKYKEYKSVVEGLQALIKSDLDQAYQHYYEVARSSDDSGLKVFATERAVNIAFWQACSGRMLEAGKHISDLIETEPYAGGVLAFAQHMQGNSALAETTARTAISKGFDDPWTLHAVAHALYSMGRVRECVEFLERGRKRLPKDCSVFMKTHFEFHIALCLIDLEQTKELFKLINEGVFWGSLINEEKKEYWAATGVLAALWKAEIRESKYTSTVSNVIASNVLKYLEDADPSKSKVFSLVILRWLCNEPTKQDIWMEKIKQQNNDVLTALAIAVSSVYSLSSSPSSNLNLSLSQAALKIIPVFHRIEELGASNEQREVIEEFAVTTLSEYGESNLVEDWLSKNRRPGVKWYDKL